MATGEGAPALLLDNVVKTYGAIRAVDGVSFTASAGEFIALLGPNGAGKTTLFQLLSGLFVPDSGRIEVMGHDMLRDPVPALAKLGIVFQQPTLDLELTVTGNLLFHAGLHGIPRAIAKMRIEAELARLGLAERAHDKTIQLSGGNRRRVELARALLHEPRVLLMDEATVGLDPASRGDLLKLMLTMRAERSVAVLWATHLCDEVADADRVIVLHRGKVLADTTPGAVHQKRRRRHDRAGIFGNHRRRRLAAGSIGSGYPLHVTIAALAAGTWISPTLPTVRRYSTSFGCQRPFAATSLPPSVTLSALSNASPFKPQAVAFWKVRPVVIVISAPALRSLLIKVTMRCP